jgi:hypothetical protein
MERSCPARGPTLIGAVGQINDRLAGVWLVPKD